MSEWDHARQRRQFLMRPCIQSSLNLDCAGDSFTRFKKNKHEGEKHPLNIKLRKRDMLKVVIFSHGRVLVNQIRANLVSNSGFEAIKGQLHEIQEQTTCGRQRSRDALKRRSQIGFKRFYFTQRQHWLSLLQLRPRWTCVVTRKEFLKLLLLHAVLLFAQNLNEVYKYKTTFRRSKHEADYYSLSEFFSRS